MDSELIHQARALAEKVFAGKAFEKRAFHNLEHTLAVVDAARKIGSHSSLSDDEMESVITAAWLHDIGYEIGAENHEDVAAEKAKGLLLSLEASPEKIAAVTEAIMATKMPQQPKTMISKVLCDADLYHLSSEQCDELGFKLREEWRNLGFKDMKDKEWLRFNLDFMEAHRYHTPYGQDELQRGKKKNIKRLRKILDPEMSGKKQKKMEEEIEKLQHKLDKRPDRGIETMFRTTSSNHIMLSEMADNKANILITINSIILSIVVSVLVRKLEENPRLIIPTIMLVLVCLATTVLAILATRPNISSGTFTREDIKGKRTNLLFFGNFFGMKIEDYEWSMKEMMKDSEYLYGSMIKDIYYLGKVLGRKYKFLRLAYNVFMFGFVLSILSFIGAFIVSPKL